MRTYGLQVTADYGAVDALVLPLREEQIMVAGERTVELSGNVRVMIDVTHDSRLILQTKGVTLAELVISVRAGAQLLVEHYGSVEGVVRLERVVTLGEAASVTDITGVEVRGQFDVLVRVMHTGARSTSRLLSKMAVAKGGRVIARGDIVVAAPGCTAFERIDALLLHASARADVLPTLHVNTDDVRCKHAATVGSIDDEHLFYLMSRGLAEQEAKEVIAQGFLDEACVYGRS